MPNLEPVGYRVPDFREPSERMRTLLEMVVHLRRAAEYSPEETVQWARRVANQVVDADD